MEESHRRQIREQHTELSADLAIHVLDIPDRYELMDPELVEMLEDAVAQVLSDL